MKKYITDPIEKEQDEDKKKKIKESKKTEKTTNSSVTKKDFGLTENARVVME